MESDLSPRQAEVLALIRESIAETGLPPTRAELATRLGVRSANAAELHLRALARKGAITLFPGASRGIQLHARAAENSVASRGLPIIGRVAAGTPILAAAHVEDWAALDPALFHPRPDYLLRVCGTSMQEVGILDGDLLAVHATPDAREGQIVVARVEDEVTVKRYHRRGHEVTLQAENPDFPPLRIDLRRQTLAIEGLVVGLLRNRSP